MKTLQAILVPVDGSSASLVALDHACVLAADYEANVEVFHVVPTRDSLSADARAEEQRAMDAAYQRAQLAMGSHVSKRVTSGDPVREIVERARDGFDLIVVGTRGATGRLHALTGSTAESLVRNAPCPVLTIRSGAGYESFAERRHHRPSLANQH